MKATYYILPFLLIFPIIQSSCTKDENEPYVQNDPSYSELTQEESQDLIFMREEEKLARDVYLYSYNLYGMRIFSNISESEQRHMDQLLNLLIVYNIPDPASSEIGVFNNTELQELYDDLIVLSAKSLLDALIVGATIEDVDIRDLDNCVSRTTNADIINVYEKLTCGSRNHMRSFSGQVESNGGSYAPQFISESKYQDIISSSKEKCGMN